MKKSKMKIGNIHLRIFLLEVAGVTLRNVFKENKKAKIKSVELPGGVAGGSSPPPSSPLACRPKCRMRKALRF